MRQYKQRWQLKNLAKDKLTGNYSEAVLFTMVYGLFLIADYVISLLLMCYSPDSDGMLLRVLFMESTPYGYLMSLGVSFLTGILINALGAGICLYYLNMACGQPFSIKDMFHGFREHPNKYLLIAIVQALVQLFCSLPAYACNYFYLTNPSDQWMMLFYICQLVGQIVAYPVILGISQSYRLLLDYPSLSARQALVKSWRLMKGHKMRLFVLNLSFLPLEIAAIFTCGIGYLWLSPYMSMTYAQFYLDLMKAEETY